MKQVLGLSLALTLLLTCCLMTQLFVLPTILSIGIANSLPYGRQTVLDWIMGTPQPLVVEIADHSEPPPWFTPGPGDRTPPPGANLTPPPGSNPNPGGGGGSGQPTTGLRIWNAGGPGECASPTTYAHSGTPSFGWPTLHHTTEPAGWDFGEIRGNGTPHVGIDMANAYGDGVYAAADGVIVFAGQETVSGYGYLVTIDHGGGWFTRYAHLKSDIVVACNQTVRQGALLSVTWNTGVTYGAHLHFEIIGYYTGPGGVVGYGEVNPWCFLPGVPAARCF
ncbi:MAG: M23 family metallopeptidase [Anaerolineales bacterium]|nr:M23 family metallopeptidase [Anaerolineales bacterium]